MKIYLVGFELVKHLVHLDDALAVPRRSGTLTARSKQHTKRLGTQTTQRSPRRESVVTASRTKGTSATDSQAARMTTISGLQGNTGRLFFSGRMSGARNSIEYAPPKGQPQGHGRSPPPITARENVRRAYLSFNMPTVAIKKAFRGGSAIPGAIDTTSINQASLMKEELLTTTQMTSMERSRNDLTNSFFNL